MLTEVGVDHITAATTQRCRVDIGHKRDRVRARWDGIVTSACAQSRRRRVAGPVRPAHRARRARPRRRDGGRPGPDVSGGADALAHLVRSPAEAAPCTGRLAGARLRAGAHAVPRSPDPDVPEKGPGTTRDIDIPAITARS